MYYADGQSSDTSHHELLRLLLRTVNPASFGPAIRFFRSAWGRKLLLGNVGAFSRGLFSHEGPTEEQMKEVPVTKGNRCKTVPEVFRCCSCILCLQTLIVTRHSRETSVQSPRYNSRSHKVAKRLSKVSKYVPGGIVVCGHGFTLCSPLLLDRSEREPDTNVPKPSYGDKRIHSPLTQIETHAALKTFHDLVRYWQPTSTEVRLALAFSRLLSPDLRFATTQRLVFSWYVPWNLPWYTRRLAYLLRSINAYT